VGWPSPQFQIHCFTLCFFNQIFIFRDANVGNIIGDNGCSLKQKNSADQKWMTVKNLLPMFDWQCISLAFNGGFFSLRSPAENLSLHGSSLVCINFKLKFFHVHHYPRKFSVAFKLHAYNAQHPLLARPICICKYNRPKRNPNLSFAFQLSSNAFGANLLRLNFFLRQRVRGQHPQQHS